MSTTATAAPDDLSASRKSHEGDRLAIRLWLYVVLAMVFALILVGGATRLTDSGLSITEWKPIHGVIPPLNEAQWQEELELYRTIPQYQQINRGMSLSEFKQIYWWEWAHRFLARGVGLVYAAGLAFFWLTRRLEPELKPRMLGILALGGLQGFVGWWMVSSGLVERTSVSQYRLLVHLMIACAIFVAILWVARGLAPQRIAPARKATRMEAGVLTGLVVMQIALGALVAGLDAGLAYNTWPLMDGGLVPGGLFILDPAWLNVFEIPKTAQFFHRTGGYVVFAFALYHAIAALSRNDGKHSNFAVIIFGLVLVQVAFGIVTLLMAVPVSWGVAHQAMAIVLLIASVLHLRDTAGHYPKQFPADPSRT